MKKINVKKQYSLRTIVILFMLALLSIVHVDELEQQLGISAYEQLGEITIDNKIEQTFSVQEKVLERITLFTANYDRENNSNLKIEILEGDRLLKEILINAQDIPNNGFFEIDLERLHVTRDTLLTLRLSSDAEKGQGVTVWYDSQVVLENEDIQLLQDGEVIQGSLVMKITTRYTQVDGTLLDFLMSFGILILIYYIFRGINPYLKVLGISTLMTLILLAISEGNLNVEPLILGINIIIIYLVMLVALLIDKKYKSGLYICWTLLALIGVVNFIKLNLKGEPFLPWDIFSIKEGLAISEENDLGTYISLETVGFVLIPYFFIYKLDIKENIKRVIRPICVTVTVTAIFVTQLLWNEDRMVGYFNISNLVWNQSNNLSSNKLPLITVMNSKYLTVEEPENYSQDAVERLVKKSTTEINKEYINEPNVIIVMNESWADLRNVNSLEIFDQVMASLECYKERSLYGFTLSPVIGGGTANAEYEVLTGQSTRFLPLGSIAYPMFIGEETFAISKYFKNKGYYSVAIHPYLRTFWNREDVYRKFLFDEYYSDEIVDSPIYKNGYIADSEVVQKIIEVSNEKGDRPLFCFAVTMQNHQPYNNPEQYEQLIDIPSGIFEEDVEKNLEVYLTGVQDANQMFIELANYIDGLDEPTLLLMFGDHYPPLGEKVYEALMGKKWETLTQEEIMEFYKTPFIAYRNYDDTSKDLGLLSMFYLLPIIFEESNIDMPYYFKFLIEQSESSKGYNSQFILDYQGNLINEIPSSIENHFMLQYNNLKGKNYFYKEIFE